MGVDCVVGGSRRQVLGPGPGSGGPAAARWDVCVMVQQRHSRVPLVRVMCEAFVPIWAAGG